MKPAGCVFFVGAGPGDPGLITVRGLDLVRRAEVLLHDRLVAREIVAQAPPGAEVIDVGKTPGDPRNSQETIHRLMVDRARAGRTVVRLKGGDPFVFGRGFEECEACFEAGVPYAVVPGVTSAVAVPAAAGIPVTHRGVSRSLAVITASFQPGTAGSPLDYPALARMDTLVILMGRAALAQVAAGLLQAGRDPGTPAAAIERGTTPDQRVVVAPLERLAQAVEEARLETPMLTVVGEVARCATMGAVLERLPGTPGGLLVQPGPRTRRTPEPPTPLAPAAGE